MSMKNINRDIFEVPLDTSVDLDSLCLTELNQIGEVRAQKLREAGYQNVTDVLTEDSDELKKVPHIGEKISEEYGDECSRTETMRFYWDDEHIYPSNTTVLSFPQNHGKKFKLNTWKNRNNSYKTDLAIHQSIGVWMHWVILSELQYFPPTKEEKEAKNQLQNLDCVNWTEVEKASEWFKEQGLKLLNNNVNIDEVEMVEEFITHPEEGFAGQCDLVVIDESDDRWMIDIKTSKQIEPSHEIQVTAYSKALEYNGYPVDHCAVLRINPMKNINTRKNNIQFKVVSSKQDSFSIDSCNIEMNWKKFKNSVEVFERSIPTYPKDKK